MGNAREEKYRYTEDGILLVRKQETARLGIYDIGPIGRGCGIGAAGTIQTVTIGGWCFLGGSAGIGLGRGVLGPGCFIYLPVAALEYSTFMTWFPC